MGIETIAAIAAPIVIGAISKAMQDSNQDPVDAANNKKTADMEAAGKKLEAYRPQVNQSIERGVRGQSTAYQGANDMLATMGLPSAAPAGLNSNPMSNIFPQNTINATPGNNAPGSVAPTPGPTIGQRPPAMALSTPSPDAVMASKKPQNSMQDALKIRAALGDFRPGNVAPTLGPQSPIGPGPDLRPDPYAAAMRGPR